MRIIKTFEDAQKVVNEILDWKDRISTKNWDFHQLKITNAADGIDARDYITLEQLKGNTDKTKKETDNNIKSAVPDQFYTIGFSKDGVVATGELSPPWIIGTDREGTPIQVWLACEIAPTSADLKINFELTRINPFDDSESTQNLLASPLTIAVGSTRRVFSSVFVSPVPPFANGLKINKVVVSGGDAAYVSMGIVIKRFK